jgi:hypothetical protein
MFYSQFDTSGVLILTTVFEFIISKKLVGAMLLQEPKLLTRMMKKLKKEYGDTGRLGRATKKENSQV